MFGGRGRLTLALLAIALVLPMAVSAEVVADTTAPDITCGAADTAWHADNVSIACSATDSESGLADLADASFSLSTGVAPGEESADAQTGTKSVCDVDGNCASAGPIGGNKIDRKGPAVSCGSAPAGWFKKDASIVCTSADGGSGLAGPASFVLTTSVPVGTADSNASTSSDKSCDAVGNCSQVGPVTGNQIDKARPRPLFR